MQDEKDLVVLLETNSAAVISADWRTKLDELVLEGKERVISFLLIFYFYFLFFYLQKLTPPLADLNSHRSYNITLENLLRAIRNKVCKSGYDFSLEYSENDAVRAVMLTHNHAQFQKHHYQTLRAPVKALYGALPEGYFAYYHSRFPKLFMHVYACVKSIA